MNIKRIQGLNKNGKNILIITGVHGNEITPIYLGYLLAKSEYIDLKNVNQITLFNSVNITGIKVNTREMNYTNITDLNRMFSVFDGNEYNSKLHDTITKLIDENDIVIDVHSSPNCSEFILVNQDEYANSYIDFAIKNNIDYLLRLSNNDTIKKYCLDMNKIVFTLEINKINEVDIKSAYAAVNIINKLMCFDVLEKSVPKYDEYVVFKTYLKGILIKNSDIKNSSIISKSDNIGKIINIEDFTETDLIFNLNDRYNIICGCDDKYVDAGIEIFYLQKVQ